MPSSVILIATRGSALALAQANMIAAQCRAAFPQLRFELKIIKTTGDKLQKASMAKTDPSLPKGLFTKELEVALLNGEADLAVHSLKDLPTELPDGLQLTATPQRADVRDVLIYRSAEYLTQNARSGSAGCEVPSVRSSPSHLTPDPSHLTPLRGLPPHTKLQDFPKGATVATSSTRRKAQLLVERPDLNIVEIRGNVATRMKKVADQAELDATVLALAGITRLNFSIEPDGKIRGDAVPDGLLATVLDVDVMLPCVGQAAIGIETRVGDERVNKLCEQLNHADTFQAVTAERAFLAGMGGGCQSPVAAYARIASGEILMSAVSFRDGPARRSQGKRAVNEAVALGQQLASELK